MTARRLFIIIPTLTAGGAERVVITLLQHLDRRQFTPSLVVIDTRNEVYAGQVPSDVELIDLGCTRVRYGIPKLVELIRKRRPEIVLSTLSHLNLALALARPWLPKETRFVARETIVVSSVLGEYRYPGLWAAMYRRLYSRFDRVICQSRDMRDDLCRTFGLPTVKTVLIPNPVDVQRIASLSSAASPTLTAAGGLALVAAGRFTQQKGFDILIRALPLLHDLAAHVYLLGDGPLARELAALAEREGVADRVHFMGYQQNPYAWYAKADAVVLPSRYEGLPNVMLEALTCGTPVIATPAPGGINEVLEGIPGCHIAHSVTAEGLATAINAWIAGPRDRIPSAAVARFEVGSVVAQYASALSD